MSDCTVCLGSGLDREGPRIQGELVNKCPECKGTGEKLTYEEQLKRGLVEPSVTPDADFYCPVCDIYGTFVHDHQSEHPRTVFTPPLCWHEREALSCVECREDLALGIPPPTTTTPDPAVTWQNTDPRSVLINRGSANIIIVRPPQHGGRTWEAGFGTVEMKHGWFISTSFDTPTSYVETWDPAWKWILAPKSDA